MRGLKNMHTTKKVLAGRVSEELGIPRSLVTKVVNGFIKSIADAVSEGERVELRNFGIFTRKQLNRRVIIHPKTQKNMQVPPRTTVKFKPGKRLKDL